MPVDPENIVDALLENEFGWSYLGIVGHHGGVRGEKVKDSTHKIIGMIHGKRWRVDLTGKNLEVFWWEEPTEEEKWAVEDWLKKRKIGPVTHGWL
jgi:hypothetical protein